MWEVTIFILIRNCITACFSLLISYQWVKKKKNSYPTISLLFLFFFLGLTFGKFLDLLYKLIYFTAEDNQILLILKLRYILIILTALPFIYFGLRILIDKIFLNAQIIKKDNYENKIINTITLFIILIQGFLIFLATDSVSLYYFLLFIHISSLIWIGFWFLYAYKKYLFPDIRVKLISIAFFVDLVLFVISNIILSFRKNTIGFSPVYIILGEFIDLLIIILIFIGYHYKTNKND
jgi:hypothetical protein